ncbi:MAG: hypothetical protein QI199_03130 [Candidatus Korarchaeota archaeon]|nr:hypothetical protein [Candidatus Korarchaeota archaeon]
MQKRIMLDSMIFRNRPFLSWLRVNLERFRIYISPIVHAETALWYLYIGLDLEDLTSDLRALRAEIPPITREITEKVAERAFTNRRALPFRHHARDYLIGAQAEHLGTWIVTYNKRHFAWVNVPVLTPEELIKRFRGPSAD